MTTTEPEKGYVMTITTGTSTITHQFLSCGCLWYCSAATPWEPQREWGWCHCAGEDADEYPMPVATAPWCDGCSHNCPPRPVVSLLESEET